MLSVIQVGRSSFVDEDTESKSFNFLGQGHSDRKSQELDLN